MVDLEGLLHAVGRDAALGDVEARVVHEHVQPLMARTELGSGAPHVGERSEVCHQQLGLAPARGSPDVGERGRPLVAVATEDDDVRALLGERDGRGLADTLVCPGDEDCLALHGIHRIPMVRAAFPLRMRQR